MNRECRSFYSDWISQFRHNQRSLFRKANSLLGLRQQQILPPHADKAARHFPSPWKRAIILPKLKRPNLDPIFSNYRPLSNLYFISKITERAASIQVVNHLTLHHLFPGTQPAYRKHHSTETALLKVTNDILLSMNRHHVSLLVLLDLSSSFDIVDHTILLNRLQSHFGICDSSLSRFESYLSDRTQFVSIKGSNSSNVSVQHGVPQGSCLGPLLSLYTSPLFDFIRSHLPDMHCYADDTQVYLSFKSDSISSEDSAFSAIQSCISAIRSWLLTNKLLINDTKTEFLIIGTRQQLSKVQTDSISVGESRISSSKVRNLGTWLDNTSQCLLRSARLSPLASTISTTSGVLESISLGKSVKLSLMLSTNYIIQLIQVKTSNCILRSSNAILLEHPTIKSSKTLGDCAFTLAAPVEWNILLSSIRMPLHSQSSKNN